MKRSATAQADFEQYNDKINRGMLIIGASLLLTGVLAVARLVGADFGPFLNNIVCYSPFATALLGFITYRSFKRGFSERVDTIK